MMIMNRENRIVKQGLFLAVALAAMLLMISCGKKGDPVPPSAAPPAAVDDLKADVDGSRVRLTWTRPATAAGVSVYRSKVRIDGPSCDGCPILFERIAGDAAGGGSAYTADLEKGHRYIFKVQVRDVYGQIADSNTVEVIF
jgi:hypothetical protein